MEWKDLADKWRVQIQDDNKERFYKTVHELIKTSELEGKWMRGKDWRIVEYDLCEVSVKKLHKAAPYKAPKAPKYIK